MARLAHGKQSGSETWTAFTPRHVLIVAGAIVAIGALTVGGVVLINHGSATPAAAHTTTANGSSGGGTASKSGGSGSTTSTTAPAPQRVLAVSPAAKAKNVTGAADITVSFSEPLSASSPTPTLSPAVAGHWVTTGSRMVFHPTGGYLPDTTVKVTVPANAAGVVGKQTTTLTAAYHSQFTTGSGSVLRLQQLLADLHYLPFNFTRTATAAAGTTTTSAVTSDLAHEPTKPDAVPTVPVAGNFTWAYPNIPPALAALWGPGQDSVMVTGAVMSFEDTHNLTVDGVAGPAVWAALMHAVAARQLDPYPYNYVEVNEVGTEYVDVWSDGKIVFTSLTNTGVPGAATAQGTFPVYSRFVETTMKGTDVDGYQYDVPVAYVSYFNGGDAVHAYPRASYGFPQSNGCVELPPADGQEIFDSPQGWDNYGVLVNVASTQPD